MFADDIKSFISDENIGELFQQMNKELKGVSTWFKANKLSINIDKTKWTIFHPTSRKCFMPTKFPELLIDGIDGKEKQSLRFWTYLLMKM